jgi:hypothetical protein
MLFDYYNSRVVTQTNPIPTKYASPIATKQAFQTKISCEEKPQVWKIPFAFCSILFIIT